MTPLAVAQISDAHLFADVAQTLMNVPTARSLQVVLEQVKAVQPDLILLTGDLSQDETPESYQQLQNLCRSLAAPIYWLPGNHDIPALMQQCLKEAPFSSQKSFQQNGWNFVLLDSTLPRCVYGELDATDLGGLEQQLQAIDRPTLIALHHPPLAIGSSWMDSIGLKNPQALFAVLQRYPQVKLVLFGHIHQAFDQLHQGVRYLGTPSTCVQFQPQRNEMAIDTLAPGFRLLHLYPDGTFTTQIRRVAANPMAVNRAV